jgi:hypothetical protein
VENHRYLNNFFKENKTFFFMSGRKHGILIPDSASPAWSLAHASDHLQKGIPLLGLKTGSLE